MKIVTWIVQGLLSVGLLMPGIMKLMTPYSELAKDPNMAWMEEFSAMQIMIIGSLEILGFLGMTIPFIIKKMKALVPVAAAGIVLLFAGAVFTHIMRGENFMVPLVLMAMALFVAYARKDLLRKTTS